MENLFSENTTKNFWQPVEELNPEHWLRAIKESMPLLQIPKLNGDLDELAEMILGEGQFGSDRWKLSLTKRAYYMLKPLLPRKVIRLLRQSYSLPIQSDFPLGWPIEPRYVHFLWEVLRQLLLVTGRESLHIKSFWPDGHGYGFVLTHDIETEKGQSHVREIMNLEIRHGFRSSFNFVPERYQLDHSLIRELQDQGFEVGLHGLKHDGKLFFSRRKFEKRANKINRYLSSLNLKGFRSPLTHRNPEWMQLLNIEYDLSFFDSDPFEAMPGGTMSIWPFMIGNFVELPYTLPQDYTVLEVLGQKTPQIWLDKVDFIEKYHGMALLNSHPDYLINKANWDVYAGFLAGMKQRGEYWHALPRQAASWWRQRHRGNTQPETDTYPIASVQVRDRELIITPINRSE